MGNLRKVGRSSSGAREAGVPGAWRWGNRRPPVGKQAAWNEADREVQVMTTNGVREVILSQDVLECLAVGHGSPPGRQGRSLDFLLEKKQVVEAVGQVAQAHRIAGRFWVCDAAGVFSHAHVAHAVGAVFDGVPVADDGREHVLVVQLVLGSAAHVVGDLGDRELLSPGLGEVDGNAFDGGYAPATAEPDVLGAELQGLDASANEFAVPLVPGGLILWRKKKRGRACIGRVRGCRSGCL